MVTVDLFSRPGCHLCEVMKEALERIRNQYPFEMREIYITEGDQFYETFKDRIPVLYINNEFAFQYHLPEEEFIGRIKLLLNN